MEQFGLAYRVCPVLASIVSITSCGASTSSSSSRGRFSSTLPSGAICSAGSGGIGNQDVDITRFSGLNGVKITEAESAPVCCAITGILLPDPRPEAAQPLLHGKYRPPPHHRFTLLLKLTCQLTNRRGLPTPLTPTIRITNGVLPSTFTAHRLSPESRPSLLSAGHRALGITKLLAGCAFRQIGDNFTVVSTPTSAINSCSSSSSNRYRRFFYRGTG